MAATCLEPTAPTTAETGTDPPGALDIFLIERTRLLGIAYRVTGGVSGAEDVVQEAWLRWQRTDRRQVKNATAFLSTITTNLAINVIQSACCRRESSAGTRLASLDDPAADPALRYEQAVEVEEALALLMARLTPDELAAYLLRKGFEYPYTDIAGLLETSVPNARQLVSRAKTQLHGRRDRPVPAESHRLLAAAFLTAARTGELADLEQQLHAGTWRQAA
ncbi:MAG: RNA polymerase subunit sigma-24 [Microlunatus sp.]|nr:RNA polymerase subunit sigma-24 [Microlunatus sp.]